MLKLLLGDPIARKLKRFQPLDSDINLLEEDIAPSPTSSFGGGGGGRDSWGRAARAGGHHQR